MHSIRSNWVFIYFSSDLENVVKIKGIKKGRKRSSLSGSDKKHVVTRDLLMDKTRVVVNGILRGLVGTGRVVWGIGTKGVFGKSVET